MNKMRRVKKMSIANNKMANNKMANRNNSATEASLNSPAKPREAYCHST